MSYFVRAFEPAVTMLNVDSTTFSAASVDAEAPIMMPTGRCSFHFKLDQRHFTAQWSVLDAAVSTGHTAVQDQAQSSHMSVRCFSGFKTCSFKLRLSLSSS